MDELFFKGHPLILRRIFKKLRVTPNLHFSLRHGAKIIEEVDLPSSTYGEFIIYDDNLPKFYFCAFYENGDYKRIINSTLSKDYRNIELFLIDIFHAIGYKDANLCHYSFLHFIIKEKKSYIKEFELIELVDFEF